MYLFTPIFTRSHVKDDFLLLDRFSWPYAVAISTLSISSILTDVARSEEIRPFSWSISLVITSFGILSILAGNLLTLALTWSLLDLVEILIRFLQVSNSQQRQHIIFSLAARITGSMLLVLTMFQVDNLTLVNDLPRIPPNFVGVLILAAGLRLGVLPPQTPYLKEIPTSRGLGTLRRLIPVAASTVLLTRLADATVSIDWGRGLVIGATLALMYGSLSWFWAKDELVGRPFWILSFASLTIIAAVQSNLLSSLAWGISLIFSGGLLFLFSWRDRRLLWLSITGLLGFVALPFTPTWFGLAILEGLQPIFWIIIILSLITLIFGYYRFMTKFHEKGEALEPWAWIVYPIGLAILPITHYWVMWVIGGIALPSSGIRSLHWWFGVVFIILLVPLRYLSRSGYGASLEIKETLRDAISLEWLYNLIGRIYRTVGNIINYFLRMLEGDGGVLWAVLISILILAIFVNIFGG